MNAFTRLLDIIKDNHLGKAVVDATCAAFNDPPRPDEIFQSAKARDIKRVRADIGTAEKIYNDAAVGDIEIQRATKMALGLLPLLDDKTDSGDDSVRGLIGQIAKAVTARRSAKSARLVLDHPNAPALGAADRKTLQALADGHLPLLPPITAEIAARLAEIRRNLVVVDDLVAKSLISRDQADQAVASHLAEAAGIAGREISRAELRVIETLVVN